MEQHLNLWMQSGAASNPRRHDQEDVFNLPLSTRLPVQCPPAVLQDRQAPTADYRHCSGEHVVALPQHPQLSSPPFFSTMPVLQQPPPLALYDNSSVRRTSGDYPPHIITYIPPVLPPTSAVESVPSSSSSQQYQQQQQGGTLPRGGREELSQTNVFISHLPTSVDDAMLRQMFGRFGTIASSVVMRDIYSGVSRGIAFVEFEHEVAAARAIASLDKSIIDNKVICVQQGKRFVRGDPTPRVFVRNIPKRVTEAELYDACSKFGTVSWLSLHADSMRYSANSESQAMAASQAVPANDPPHTGPEQFPLLLGSPASLMSSDTFDRPNPEISLSSSLSSGSSSVHRQDRNIAFVTFASKEAASAAAAGLHNAIPFPDADGVPLLTKVVLDNLPPRRQRKASSSLSTASLSSSTADAGRSTSTVPACGAPPPDSLPVTSMITGVGNSNGALQYHPPTSFDAPMYADRQFFFPTNPQVPMRHHAGGLVIQGNRQLLPVHQNVPYPTTQQIVMVSQGAPVGGLQVVTPPHPQATSGYFQPNVLPMQAPSFPAAHGGVVHAHTAPPATPTYGGAQSPYPPIMGQHMGGGAFY